MSYKGYPLVKTNGKGYYIAFPNCTILCPRRIGASCPTLWDGLKNDPQKSRL
ncbi:MAG: hypothetical protein HQ541_14040 [Mariniphaga sp.]|nr:hypothetical protein [Mariniphaga sp.]